MPLVTVGRGAGATLLHYDRAGSGEPLLWITGFAISSEIFTGDLAAYTDRFDCIRYDNRGAGRSGASWRPTSIPELAGDAVGLLDELGVDSAHVYGLSMGGMIAQEMAIRFPDRVRGLVLGATTPGGPRAFLPSPELVARLGDRRAPAGLLAEAVSRALFSPEFQAGHPQEVRAALELLGRHRATARGLLGHWVSTCFHDTYARLPRITAPTLVLHGGRDRLSPVGNAELLATRIPDATLRILPGAGHAYLAEDPAASRSSFVQWMQEQSPITAGPPLTALAARVEPVTRVMGLPVGAFRTGRSLLGLPAAYAGRIRPPASGRPPGTRSG